VNNLQFREETIHWNVIFTRPIQNLEVEMVLSFFKRLYSFKLRQGDEDRKGWSPSKRSKFEVKSFYQVLISPNGSPFSRKSIWRVKDPLQLVFFVWTVALGKILTLDNLRKRNAAVVEWCCMCKKSGESIDN
jgi:hypothetical protein